MKNLPINIRFAETRDAYAIASIHVASWKKIYRGLIPDALLDSMSIELREKKWFHWLSKGEKILLIEKESQIIGFADISAARDLDTNPKVCGEICAIYLHPDFWHQGFGKKLCTAAFIELKKMHFDEVIVWSLEGNKQARRFYESMGFVNSGIVKDETLKACKFSEVIHDKTVEDFVIQEIKYHKKLSDGFMFKPLEEDHQ